MAASLDDARTSLACQVFGLMKMHVQVNQVVCVVFFIITAKSDEDPWGWLFCTCQHKGALIVVCQDDASSEGSIWKLVFIANSLYSTAQQPWQIDAQVLLPYLPRSLTCSNASVHSSDDRSMLSHRLLPWDRVIGTMLQAREAEHEEVLPANMQIIRVPGDGLCLFRSLCLADPSVCRADPSAGGALEMRALLVEYLHDQAPSEGTDGGLWAEESQALRDDPALHGGHTSIVAFSKMRGKRIVVHDSLRRLACQATHPSSKHALDTIHLLYNGRDHYDLLQEHGEGLPAAFQSLEVMSGAKTLEEQRPSANPVPSRKIEGRAYVRRMRALMEEGKHTLPEILAALRVEHPLVKGIGSKRLQQVIQRELRALARQGKALPSSSADSKPPQLQHQQPSLQPAALAASQHDGKSGDEVKVDTAVGMMGRTHELLRASQLSTDEIMAQLKQEFPHVRPARLRASVAQASRSLGRLCSRCGGTMRGRRCKDSGCRAAGAQERKKAVSAGTAGKRGPITEPKSARLCKDCGEPLARSRVLRCEPCRSTAAKRARTEDWSLRMQHAGVKSMRIDKRGVAHSTYASNRDITMHIEHLQREREEARSQVRALSAELEAHQPAPSEPWSHRALMRDQSVYTATWSSQGTGSATGAKQPCAIHAFQAPSRHLCRDQCKRDAWVKRWSRRPPRKVISCPQERFFLVSSFLLVHVLVRLTSLTSSSTPCSWAFGA